MANGQSVWDDDARPLFIDCDTAAAQSEDLFLQSHVQEWISIARIATLSVHSLVCDDGPAISDSEQEAEEHGDCIEGMYALGTESSDQARISRRTGGLDIGSVTKRQDTELGTSK
jgi:hypothetical protein